MSNNRWLRKFLSGALLSCILSSNIFAQNQPVCGNGLLETNEQCDLGKLNSDASGTTLATSGCSTKCEVNTGWNCSRDGVDYLKTISDKTNPNSLISLYITLVNMPGTGSDGVAPYNTGTAVVNCQPGFLSSAIVIDSCRQYVKNVALFKELNSQVSIETAGGGIIPKAGTTGIPVTDCTKGVIQDVDLTKFELKQNPVVINCKPDQTKGIR